MNGDDNDTSTGGQGGQQIGGPYCAKGHKLPTWGGDRCQSCWDAEVLDRENKRLALIERDVVTREVSNVEAVARHKDWLAHTKDWREINEGLVKAADRQAAALEDIAAQLKSIARRP